MTWDYIHLHKVLSYFEGKTFRKTHSLYAFIKSSLILYAFVLISALGSYLNWKSIERYKKITEKEKRIISIELDFLKNQFNSHLTFNFFNFCYSKMLRYSPKAAESIEYFSEMLHYSLTIESNKKTPLIKEIEYIENFISVQKCISTKVFVEFNVKGNVNDCTIIPMILPVFVENSFKHGIINDSNFPISIKLISQNDNISFSLENKKTNQKTITSTGIGLENIKQTLNLFYENKYLLEIIETDTTYLIKLLLNNNKYE